MFSVGNFKEGGGRLWVRQFLRVDLKMMNMSAHVWGRILN